jgi:CCR4-NOT transcription complex subunit 7/8
MVAYHKEFAHGNSISNSSFSIKMKLCRYDVINNDSRDLLTNAGISFQRLKERGIKAKDFAEYLVASGINGRYSGIVLNPRVKWVVFHGGYDFAYLLKMVHGDGLPESIEQFYALMKIYYPNIYDLKYFIKDIPNLKDVGLTKLANEIGVNTIFNSVQSYRSAASGRK